ncbi:MAG TPA: prepilin-type N-terminal cleavage/methylation domain-containing protein [Candidatus Saccharimonadales bacterium]|nr:prepilin-type N-terminal cleavage/methylation domain-containing protein [Candidatus Saccharimonadales bacterium]
MTSHKPGPVPRWASRTARPSNAGGFSLLELSIVLVIIGLVAGVSIDMGLYTIDVVKQVANNHKLNVIEQSLMSYRLANERLPCPADATLATTSAYYGYEAGTLSGSQWVPDAGSCMTNGTYTNTTSGAYTSGVLTSTAANSVAANYNVLIPKGANNTSIASNTYVAEGAVPFKALGLPESFMYDAWGHKFAYAVWAPDTGEGAFLNYGINPSCGAITVNDPSGSARTQSAVYALLSFGPNGHGSYLKSGTRYFAGSDNGNGGASPQPPVAASEWQDCHCNATADAANYTATYVQKPWTQDPGDSKDTFDDTVRFKMRWQMTDKHDFFSATGLPCTPGFRIDGTIAGQTIGYGHRLVPSTSQMITADINGDGIPDLVIIAGNFHVYVIFGQPNVSDFPNPFLLSSLNGTNGVDISVGQNSWAGNELLGVIKGDFNGDGIDDLAIRVVGAGACTSDDEYILFGQKSGWPAAVNLKTSNTSSSPAVYHGQFSSGCYNTGGMAAASIRGVNGSGGPIQDLILGNPYATENGGLANAGLVDVIFGNANPASMATSEAALNGSNGFQILGYRASGVAGISLATGDFNEDGNKDILIGGQYGYAVWGHSSSYSWPASINLGALNASGSDGFEFSNAGAALTTQTVRAGDINGDGHDDAILIGINNPFVGPGVGTVIYVLFGTTSWPASNTFYSASINGTNGTELEGSWAVGDVTMVGANQAVTTSPSGNTFFTGFYTNCCSNPYAHFAAFYPQSSPWPVPFNTTSLTGSNGFRFTGLTGSGGSDALGDVTGDSISDYLMGDIGYNSSAGAVYVIKGGQSMPASLTPSTLSGYGYEIDGATANDQLGTDLTTLDINHDGVPDIAVCASNASYGAANSGSCYVIWGHKGSWLTKLNLDVLN